MSEDTQGRKRVGFVVGGSLKDNLQVRLQVPAQEVQEGAFVVIESGDWLFHGLVTDLQLGATDPRFADEPGGGRLPQELASLLHGQTLYTNLQVLPALMMERGPEPGTPEYAEHQKAIEAGLAEETGVLPVKTVPAHHAAAMLASQGDIAEIFGDAKSKDAFVIGTTREQGHPVRINLRKLVQRSSGIFGATGTGKSFLTLVVLAGLIKHDQVSLLIFDMHNEYAYDVHDKNKGTSVAGLQQKFGKSKVQIVGLGSGSNAIYRGNAPDINLEIAKDDIQIEDIELLWSELNLRDTAPNTLNALATSFGEKWFSRFMALGPGRKEEGLEDGDYPEDTIEGWAERHNIHPKAVSALHSRLKNKIDSLNYVTEGSSHKAVDQIVDALKNGKHVILSFGKHDRDLDYLLVSNLLTRKIRAKWEDMMTKSYNEKTPEPRPLVIVVEEAHKLLNKELASQTTFSTIARELRKYNVTLLVIDQRPSQIYDEVMSQLGTRISGWLGDDDDIRAVLSGLAGRETLKGMLSRLQSGEDVLLLGPWGVPMPLPVRSRRFNNDFWQEELGDKTKGSKSEKQLTEELGF